MWSGPRNISTALMRAWENRSDTLVVDEPLYPHYLAVTGIDHPGRDEVVGDGRDRLAQGRDARLLGPVPPGVRVFYQKHMAHHLTADMADHAWMADLANLLLIRDPREVVASYVKSRAEVTPADIGLDQQVTLAEELTALGQVPPIIDAGDFLRDPRGYLIAICDRYGLPFEPTMLRWPSGPRDTDGTWGRYWYASVWRSTGFDAYRPRAVNLSGHPADVAAACMPAYERLAAMRWVL